MLVIGSSDLRHNTQKTLINVQEFLELPVRALNADSKLSAGPSGYRLDHRMQERLSDWFMSHNTRLENLLGKLPRW